MLALHSGSSALLRLTLVLGIAFLMCAFIAGFIGAFDQPWEGSRFLFVVFLGLAAFVFGGGLILRAFGKKLLAGDSKRLPIASGRD